MNKYTNSILLLLVLTMVYIACNTTKANIKSTRTPSTRPNIIFIMSDDHTSQAITAYNDLYSEYFSTPNIDKLAKEGMKFDNVYCSNAICGPSRATILTGKYSHRNGLLKNKDGGKFNTNQWTFPEELHNHGYNTALVGKWHLGATPKGFDFFMYHDNPGQQGYYWNPTYNLNGKQVKKEGYCTNITTNTALGWLDSIKTKDQPFALLLHFKAPHREWSPDKKYENMYPNTDMPYPPTFNDNYKGREHTLGDTWMTMDYFSNKDMKLTPPEGLKEDEIKNWQHYGGIPKQAFMPEGCSSTQDSRKWKYQRFIKDYLACVKSVDDNVGRVLDFLKTNDLEHNTIVVYTGDQGFYLGDHGLFDKRFIYDTALKMPFLMRYPDKIKPGSTNQHLISNVDFAPTLIEFANIDIPKEVQGYSFKKSAEGHLEIKIRDKVYYHYYEWPLWHHVHPHYGMRTSRYKIVHFYHDQDIWELYDLEADPDELNNLIDNPNFKETINQLKVDLNNLMIEVGEPKDLIKFKALTNEKLGHLNY